MDKQLVIEAEGLKQDICRFCLTMDVQLAHIYSGSSSLGSTIAEAAMECATIQISPNDGLPMYVCKDCFLKLQDTQQFKKMVLKSDAVLRTYLKQLRIDRHSTRSSFPIKDDPCDLDEALCMDENGDDKMKTEDTDNNITASTTLEDITSNSEENINLVGNSSPDKLSSSIPKDSGLDAQSEFENRNLVDREIIDADESDNREISGTTSDYVVEMDATSSETEDDADNCEIEESGSRSDGSEEQTHDGSQKVKVKKVAFSEGERHSDRKKQHKCHMPGCSKVYGKALYLRVHLRRHTGEKPFVCDWPFCSKDFIRSDELLRHKKIHTGKRRFQCLECDKKFMRRDHLSRHIKTHTKQKTMEAATSTQPASLDTSGGAEKMLITITTETDQSDLTIADGLESSILSCIKPLPKSTDGVCETPTEKGISNETTQTQANTTKINESLSERIDSVISNNEKVSSASFHTGNNTASSLKSDQQEKTNSESADQSLEAKSDETLGNINIAECEKIDSNKSNDHETSGNISDNSSVSDHTDDWVLEEDSTSETEEGSASETEEDSGSSDDSAENKFKNNKKNNLKRKMSEETFSRKRVLRRHTKRTPNEQETSDTFNKINSSKENENLLISNAVEKLISANSANHSLDVQTNEPLENSNIAELDILNTNKRSDQEKSRYSLNDNTLDNAVERDYVDALHSEEVGSKDDTSEKKSGKDENTDFSKPANKLTFTSSASQSLETQSEESLEKTNHENISDAKKRKGREKSGSSTRGHVSESAVGVGVSLLRQLLQMEDNIDDRQAEEVDLTDDNSEKESEKNKNPFFECKICKKLYTSKDSLCKHILKEHNNIFQCEICKKSFSSKSDLCKHAKKIHGSATNENKSTSNEQETSSKLDSSKENDNSINSKPANKLTFTSSASQSLETQSEESLEKTNHENISDAKKRKGREKSGSSTRGHVSESAVEVGVSLLRQLLQMEDNIDDRQAEEVDLTDDNSEKESEKNKNPFFECKICKKFYNRRDNLHRHIFTVHKNKLVNCQICEKSFVCKDGLNRHVKKIHGSAEQSINENKSTSNKQEISSELEKMNSSKENDNSINSKSANQSLKTQSEKSLEKTDQENISDVNKRKDDFDNWRSEKVVSEEDSSYENKRIKFKCEICKLSFTTRYSFRRHHLRKHESDLTKHEFKCEKCEKNYASKDTLLRHMTKVHESNKNENEIGIYSCNTCNEKFEERRECYIHEVRHFDKNYQPGKPIQCNVCGKSFETLCKLKLHIRGHDDGDRPFQCTKCDKKFMTKYDLAKHQRVHGDTGISSICPICGKAVKFNMSQHIERHSENRPYMCHECGKSYKDKKSLNEHKETHDGKMVECKICNKSFKGELLLRGHIKNRHHGKEFKCKICFKISSSKQTLKIHIERVHQKKHTLNCSECKKAFFSPMGLMFHKKSAHSRAKPFECQECGKGFTRKDFLVMHLRMHSGEKPYKCDKCDKRFSRNDNLKIHLKKVHGKSMKYKCQVCDKKFKMKRDLDSHIEDNHNVPM